MARAQTVVEARRGAAQALTRAGGKARKPAKIGIHLSMGKVKKVFERFVRVIDSAKASGARRWRPSDDTSRRARGGKWDSGQANVQAEQRGPTAVRVT